MSAAARRPKRRSASDARLRKAFELAIDRNVINRVAFNGEFVADNQMIPPSSPFYSKAHPIPARNVAKAKELMAAAGATKVPVEITYRERAHRWPRRADRPIDGVGGGLRRQAAAA